MANFYINKFDCEGIHSFDDLEVKGYFSLNGEHEVKFDCSELRYYKERKNGTVHLDLNHGIENALIFDSSKASRHKPLDHFLRWIKEKHETIGLSSKGEKWLKPDFICRKGVLETILGTLYQPKDGWIVCAMKWRGNIYLGPFSSKGTVRREDRSPFHKAASCWGYKFEQYMSSECADEPPNIDEPVQQNSHFSVIFQSRVGDHVLLYSGILDAVYSNETMEDPLPLDKLKFVELRTTRIIENEFHEWTFKKFTCPRLWCKCAPAGIKNAVCGFRDHEGIVRELQTYTLDQLTNITKNYMDPATWMNFLDKFLTFIASNVVNDCDKTIYKFERIPNRHIRLTEELPASEYNFIPQWYMENNS